ncbi:MAG: sialate O-acetylesterase, partial [Marinoscillum sp.]
IKKADFKKKQIKASTNYQAYQLALKEGPGVQHKWEKPGTNYAEWSSVDLPAKWESTKIGNQDGIIWFARSFEVPEEDAGKRGVVSLGPVDDWDDTYINGHLVGHLTDWTAKRRYQINEGILKPGTNWVVVKVTDGSGGGGLYGEPDELFVQTESGKSSLTGSWKYKTSVLASDFGIEKISPNEFPTQLYNAMIAPLTNLAITGVIWYQGEKNTSNPQQYQELFPTMIRDWRLQFGQEFPFLWVQLANFMAPDAEPSNSNWAELREAQSMTLSLPKTGQAVIIDLGEANDIHPRNKKDVGERLALTAKKVAYGQDVVYSGPTFKSMEIIGNEAIITFSNIGGGLVTRDKYGYVKGFAIAGENGRFVWAKAKISGDQVIVTSDQVLNPVYIRYAWGDNPDDANLYNKEGLPASPFRTGK